MGGGGGGEVEGRGRATGDGRRKTEEGGNEIAIIDERVTGTREREDLEVEERQR